MLRFHPFTNGVDYTKKPQERERFLRAKLIRNLSSSHLGEILSKLGLGFYGANVIKLFAVVSYDFLK